MNYPTNIIRIEIKKWWSCKPWKFAVSLTLVCFVLETQEYREEWHSNRQLRKGHVKKVRQCGHTCRKKGSQQTTNVETMTAMVLAARLSLATANLAFSLINFSTSLFSLPPLPPLEPLEPTDTGSEETPGWVIRTGVASLAQSFLCFSQKKYHWTKRNLRFFLMLVAKRETSWRCRKQHR